MCDKLRAKFDELTAQHPDLQKQLEAGILLALGGSVEQVPGEDIWRVASATDAEKKYLVGLHSVAFGVLWYCECQSHTRNAPGAVAFDGNNGNVCKHIAAVAIARTEPMEPVASVFDFLARLVAAQWLPRNPGDSFELPGTKVRVVCRRDGCIVLKQGHNVSKALVEPRVEGGGTKWDFTGEDRHFVFIGSMDSEPTLARVNYDRWVKSLGGDNEV